MSWLPKKKKEVHNHWNPLKISMALTLNLFNEIKQCILSIPCFVDVALNMIVFYTVSFFSIGFTRLLDIILHLISIPTNSN